MTIFKLGRLAAVSIVAAGLCLSSTVRAQTAETPEAKIARAVSAAPARISAAATVMDVDGSVLRPGTNGWTCLPGVALIPGDKHPMCNDAVWMRWMAAAAEGRAFHTDTVGTSYMLQGDARVNNADPMAMSPDDGGMWVQEGPHLMMLYPTPEMIADLPRDPGAGGPYVMWDKTPLVHVMVPVTLP